MQIKIMRKCARCLLVLTSLLVSFVVLSNIHVNLNNIPVEATLYFRIPCSRALATEATSKEEAKESKNKESVPEEEPKESEKGAEAESKPVKYSEWQDVYALIIAVILIAVAYSVVRRLADQSAK